MAVATQGRVIKDGYKVGLSLREIFRRVVAEVICNFRNKIHPIWGLLLANQCIHTHQLPIIAVHRAMSSPSAASRAEWYNRNGRAANSNSRSRVKTVQSAPGTRLECEKIGRLGFDSTVRNILSYHSDLAFIEACQPISSLHRKELHVPSVGVK